MAKMINCRSCGKEISANANTCPYCGEKNKVKGSNMKNCRTCGEIIAKSANKCPHCGAKQNQGIYAICWIIVIAAIAICVSVLSGSGGSENANVSKGEINVTNSENADQLLYEDANMRITFLDAYEEKGIDGAFYLQLLIDNLSDSRAWVYLDNLSVDGYSTIAMSGVPMKIDSGKISKQPFIISYQNIGADSIDDVNEIKFTVQMKNDDDSSDIGSSEIITLNIGK